MLKLKNIAEDNSSNSYIYMLVQKGQCIKVSLYSSRFYISIYNNEYYHYYSMKWRWFMVDIYQTEKWQGKYPPLATDTEVRSCFSINYYS